MDGETVERGRAARSRRPNEEDRRVTTMRVPEASNDPAEAEFARF
jgi:hypothetical protein